LANKAGGPFKAVGGGEGGGKARNQWSNALLDNPVSRSDGCECGLKNFPGREKSRKKIKSIRKVLEIVEKG